MAGSQNLKADQEQIQMNNSGHRVCEYMGDTHSSQHTAPDAKRSSTRCCPTHEMWELPTPLIVANRSQQGDEVYGSYPPSSIGILSNTDLTPNELPERQAKSDAYANRLENGDVFAHLTSFTQASKSSTKQSVLARGVQRYHSYFRRSYLPSAIVEDKATVDRLIRSTTGIKTPSSACTRRPDEFSMDGEGVAAAALGGGRRRREGEEKRGRPICYYGPFNTYIPIRSTTIGKSRVARDLIAMHTSWRSNSDIASVTRQTHLPKTHPVLWPEIYHTIVSSDNIGYPRMKASSESSTTKHRLLHASGPHPIPPPNDPKTNQYNQDLGLIHSTNGNHLESPNEGSSIDHQVTIHLNAQNITMFPTNETWYFTSQIPVSSSGGLILILTAQSTRNEFRMHSDY
ncbi:hypothetical protein F511_20891 [Dorcoceras hygrometricum]|uniref:Uncharacterized protein n=1 Tax=Dorcoceras hygrometricum TaxID=472368 RepID=A0A2Z7BD74_9LAMI|nr:hypothetical protein F511_20891 [Dorcoceras hygrometricum]